MLSLIVVLLATANPVSIAEPDFNAVNVTPEIARFCGEQLATQMASYGVRVMTQRQIASLLGMERQKELLGCADTSTSCMAELANALGADGVMLGDLARLGTHYQLTVKVLASGNGELLSTYSTTLDSEDALLPALNEAAKKVSKEVLDRLRPPAQPVAQAQPQAVKPTEVDEVPETPRVHHWPLWPTVAAGGFLVAGGVLHAIAASDAAQLTNPNGAPMSQRTAEGLRNSGKTLQTCAYVGYGLAAASLGVAAFLYARGEPAATAFVTPNGGGVAVSGVLP